MASDAEGHAEADKKKRESIEVRNEADAAVHNTKKNLDEHKANLPQEVQDEVQTKIVELEQMLSEDEANLPQEVQDEVQTKIVELEQMLSEDEVEAEEVRKAVDELQQAAMKMGEAIYKSSSANAEEAPVEDAEFEDKDKKKDEEKKD